ncbi:Gamma-tubulin complex, DGRIP91/SPC98 component [Phaffia rhodozyma]|uniref:Gamma-tubulin complex, DGRIP91/SPC98 component n=1 Tax=Phaffia rhodozyma TaxID=264483 RepID=A0A0F7SI24_PHARH|nr:Gamma-tubulin complex, DGRIP91/SPC98 component [Phaffia rhodozyma]
MAALSRQLASLVETIVPDLAQPHHLEDGPSQKEREDRRSELIEYVKEVLNSRIATSSNTPSDQRSLINDIKKRILTAPSSSSTTASSLSVNTGSGTDRAIRFGNLWSKVESSGLLGLPAQQLQFLLSLSNLSVPTFSSSSSVPTPIFPLPFESEQPALKLRVAPPFKAPEFGWDRAGDRLRSAPSVSDKNGHAGRTDKGKEKEIEESDWRKGASKSDIMRRWMDSRGSPVPSTSAILRDALYLIQGIDGTLVKFDVPAVESNKWLKDQPRPPKGGFKVDEEGEYVGVELEQNLGLVGGLKFEESDGRPRIPFPIKKELACLAEIGWLYRTVDCFVKECNEKKGPRFQSQFGMMKLPEDPEMQTPEQRKGGMVEQSVCHFLETQLTAYSHLISVLQTQLDSVDQSGGDGKGSMTLSQLDVWTREARLKMEWMNSMVDDCRVSHGGALVSRIHVYTENGDPFARKFADEVLEQVSKPFFNSLQRWIYHGELKDPYSEFFVRLNPDLASHQFVRLRPFTGAEDVGFEDSLGIEGRNGIGSNGQGVASHELWRKKYEFKKEMLPSFVSEAFGRKIYSTGKSLNFIRYSCQDSDWIATRSKLEDAGKDLQYSDIDGLERSIDAAYEIASKRLLEVFFDKFKLMEHVKALKQFLLLGHGDFVDDLMRALSSDLSRPANQLYRHTLTGTLEAAIRGSNAVYDAPEVRRRLDARMLPYAHGEIGWDCFILEYKVDAPIDTVLDPRAMEGYQRMFIHLWKLKRVESTLNSSWMRLTAGNRNIGRSSDTREEWHHCRIIHAEMVHFIRQLQAFYQLEVIECSWQAFEELIQKNEDGLDGLMSAHKEYIGRLITRILLVTHSRSGNEELLLKQVQQAFQVILDFVVAIETLYRFTLEDEVRLDSARDAGRGVYTRTVIAAPRRNEGELDRLKTQIRDLSGRFQDLIGGIVGSAAGHPDPEIKLFAIRCSYNAFYNLRPIKEKRKDRARA